MKLKRSPHGQVMPESTCPFGTEAFLPTDHTEIRWLGGAAVSIHSRGTNVLIDPLLTGFDMPLLFDIPLKPQDVPSLDALLITHIDNDHFDKPTCHALSPVCKSYHASQYVAEVMRQEQLNAFGHDIGETFSVNQVSVTLTPADHNWQSGLPEYAYRVWKKEDYCGFLLDTPDGRIWLPGDSRLLDSHLHIDPQPDVILMDFSENSWHIGFENAVKLADTYPDAALICIHWGTVDAPDFNPFNGDPAAFAARVSNPQRVHALAPGEPFPLRKN